MKKIVVIMMILVIPLITVEKVNNKNYYLETETDTYTKEEIDNKIKELKDKIDSNSTNIIETKNILTEIKSKLNDYALKTSLNKTNEDIENLLTLANQNKTRIDELETSKSNNNIYVEYRGTKNGTHIFPSKSMSISDYDIVNNGGYLNIGDAIIYNSDKFDDPTITINVGVTAITFIPYCFTDNKTMKALDKFTAEAGQIISFKISEYNDSNCLGVGFYQYAAGSSNALLKLSVNISE